MVKLAAGPRFLRPVEGIEVAGASAICQRRQQLGVAPMVTLFRDVCHPLATPNTRDAYLFGLRLMAVDGTVEDVADTPANSSYFGRQTGSRGNSAFPQMRCVYLCECGKHAICDAGVWPYQISERTGGLRVLRSVGADMLVMVRHESSVNKEATVNRAVTEVREGPSEPPCRWMLQTTVNGYGQKP